MTREIVAPVVITTECFQDMKTRRHSFDILSELRKVCRAVNLVCPAPVALGRYGDEIKALRTPHRADPDVSMLSDASSPAFMCTRRESCSSHEVPVDRKLSYIQHNSTTRTHQSFSCAFVITKRYNIFIYLFLLCPYCWPGQ